MKKISALILILSVCFAAGCGKSKSSDTSLADIKKKGFFVLGLDDQFPPMGFREKGSNEIVGFDIDLAREVAKRLGVELKLKSVEWKGVILSLKKGDIDLIWNGMTITPERQKQITFSKAYLDNRQIIVIKKGSKVASKADLKGKIVGLQLGSSSEKALSDDAATSKSLKEVKKYSNNTLALLDLAAGRVDAVVVDEIVGRYYIAKKADQYDVIKDDFGHEEYGVGFRQEDVSFSDAVNKALSEMKKDGTGSKISKKWFGADILK